MYLNKIQQNKKAIITDIKDSNVKNNLSRLGIFVGNEIYVSKIAPFGSPISLKIKDFEIAIRKDVAKLIEVELI